MKISSIVERCYNGNIPSRSRVSRRFAHRNSSKVWCRPYGRDRRIPSTAADRVRPKEYSAATRYAAAILSYDRTIFAHGGFRNRASPEIPCRYTGLRKSFGGNSFRTRDISCRPLCDANRIFQNISGTNFNARGDGSIWKSVVSDRVFFR